MRGGAGGVLADRWSRARIALCTALALLGPQFPKKRCPGHHNKTVPRYQAFRTLPSRKDVIATNSNKVRSQPPFGVEGLAASYITEVARTKDVNQFKQGLGHTMKLGVVAQRNQHITSRFGVEQGHSRITRCDLDQSTFSKTPVTMLPPSSSTFPTKTMSWKELNEALADKRREDMCH